MATTPFKITDFPSEILERFAPDEEPSTVSTLRLVCRRFRDVFCSDRFYRGYIRYTKDLTDEPDDVDVATGRWKSRLDKEKRLLAAWRSGRAARVEAVRIPAEDMESEYGYWIGVQGEGGDQYLMKSCHFVNKILLINAKNSPSLTVINVGPYIRGFTMKNAFLLPDQVLIDDGDKYLQIFDIQNDGIRLSLKELFRMDRSSIWVATSGKSVSRNGAFLSLFVRYQMLNCDKLWIWDLKRAARMEDIDLHQVLPKEIFDLGPSWSLIVLDIGFPHVVLKFNFYYPEMTVFALMNVDEGRVIFWFRKDPDFTDYTLKVFGNSVMIVQEKRDHQFYCDVRLFDYRTIENNLEKTVPTFRFASPNCFYFDYSPPTLFLAGWKLHEGGSSRVLHVISTVGDRREIDVSSMNCNPWSIIGPYLLVSGPEIMRTLDMDGRIIFNWGDMLRGLDDSYAVEAFKLINIHPFSSMSETFSKSFSNLSKYVLQNKEGDLMVFCYFEPLPKIKV